MASRLFYIGCLLLWSHLSVAQQQDIELWLGAGVDQKLHKKHEIGIEEGLRFNNRLANMQNLFTQVSYKYKPLKSVRVGVGYRNSYKQSWEKVTGFEHRFQADAQWRYKFNKKTELNTSARWQSKVDNYYSSRYGHIPEHYLRQKTSLEGKMMKDVRGFVAFEWYYPLRATQRYIDRNRYFVGLNIELSKHASLKPYYLLEINKGLEMVRWSHVQGLDISWQF